MAKIGTHSTHTGVGAVTALKMIRRSTVLQAEGTGRIARFGAFELDRQTGELRKHGIKIRLQGKPFQILLALLERPGETVSRDDLRQRLWPGDTFVDFESGLNTAANRLRIALGDSADNPRYVETLARSGYRFIAPVEEVLPPPALETDTHSAPEVRFPDLPRNSVATSRRWLYFALLVAVGGAGIIAGRMVTSKGRAADVRLQQITFRRGAVPTARFAPDGSVIYTAQWMNEPKQVYVANALSPESRALGFPRTVLAAVSRSGELALLQANADRPAEPLILSRVPINGGAPLELAKGVAFADWSPDGSQLAIIRHADNQDVIEYPIGKAIYKSWGLLSELRVSPKGNALAFFEHPYRGDDGGDVVMVDLTGHAKKLAPGWASAAGIAWAPSGDEVYFTAARQGAARALHAVSTSGVLRTVARVPGALLLHDISPDGRMLVSRESRNLVMERWTEESNKRQDLSWFDWSNAIGSSEDGDLILFDESGEGGGPQYTTYLHRLSTKETTRLGAGRAMALSPDGKYAITMQNSNHTQVQVVPVGPGQPRTIEGNGVEYLTVKYLPDGHTIVLIGHESDAPMSLYTQDLNGGPPKLLRSDVQPFWLAVSSDGSTASARTRDGKLLLQPLKGGNGKLLATAFPAWPIRWTKDPNQIYAMCAGSGPPSQISTLDLRTGECTPFHTVFDTEPEAMCKMDRLVMSADGSSIVYSYHRNASELYIALGW